MGSFSADGKYQEGTQKVVAILKGNKLKFNTNQSGIMPGKSYLIDFKTGAYTSTDLEYQTSPDGSFKVAAKGTCDVPN